MPEEDRELPRVHQIYELDWLKSAALIVYGREIFIHLNLKCPYTQNHFSFKRILTLFFVSRMPKKILISVQTSIFCELSKSGKIAIIGNTIESMIRSKGSGSNLSRSEFQNAYKTRRSSSSRQCNRSTSEFQISWSPFWFDRRVLAAKIKIDFRTWTSISFV